MEEARSARVWAAISVCARQEGTPVSARHAVTACADALAAAGAALSLSRDGAPREPVLATAPAVEELEELQFTLGEGPGMDSAAGHGLVFEDDMTSPKAHRRWPAFGPAAADRGVRGVFAFPVAVGAALVGVIDVYRLQPGPLTAEELADGLVFADAVLALALNERSGILVGVDTLAQAALSPRRAQVHQATGMVAAQLDLSMPDALAALRAAAYTRGQRLADLAAEVLARRVRLASDRHDDDRPDPPHSSPQSRRSGPGGMRDDGSSQEPGNQPGRRHEEEG